MLTQGALLGWFTEKGKNNEVITFTLDHSSVNCDWLRDLRFDSCKLGG